MDSQDLLEHLAELASRLGISIRKADLGGSGGSLVNLKGRQILFIDTLAEATDQLERIIPELRELLDQYK